MIQTILDLLSQTNCRQSSKQCSLTATPAVSEAVMPVKYRLAYHQALSVQFYHIRFVRVNINKVSYKQKCHSNVTYTCKSAEAFQTKIFNLTKFLVQTFV